MASTVFKNKSAETTAPHISAAMVAEGVSQALRVQFRGVPAAVKRLARAMCSNERAARNWIEGANAPSAAVLIDMMARFDAVHDAVLEMAGRRKDGDALCPVARRRIDTAVKILQGEIAAHDHDYRDTPLGGVLPPF